MTTYRLEAQNLSFLRGKRPVLTDIHLTLKRGDIIALLGANGSGKTTLLRCLLGLLRADNGQAILDGKPLHTLSPRTLARRLAYVPQTHNTPFPYTVLEVVTLGRLPYHSPLSALNATDHKAIEAALLRLGIAHLAHRPYTELSGGEQQLTLIARAITQGGHFLIMDEPMGGLDFGHQLRLLRYLEQLAAEGYGILKTTHSPDQALGCATRVALLENTRISADGPPMEVLTAQTIHRLYQVDVELVQASNGKSAFIPVY